jgi:hypothetical protein
MATAVAVINADSDVLEKLLYRYDTFRIVDSTTQNTCETGKIRWGEKSVFSTSIVHFVSYL